MTTSPKNARHGGETVTGEDQTPGRNLIMNILPDSNEARTAIRRWAVDYSVALGAQAERALSDPAFADYVKAVGLPVGDVDAQRAWALSTTNPPEWPAAATPAWVESTDVADGDGGTVVVMLNGAPHRVGESEALLSAVVTVVVARDTSDDPFPGLVEVGDHIIGDEISVGWTGPQAWTSSDWRAVDAFSKALRGAALQLRDVVGEVRG